jgi:Phosphatase
MDRDLLAGARDALIASGVVGSHQSHSRRDNVAKVQALTSGDEDASFGISSVTDYSPEEVLGWLSDLTSCSRDLGDLEGADTIDPDRTMDALVRAADRLSREAAKGATLLAATGHPTGLLELYIRIVDAYRAAGGKMVRLKEEQKFPFGSGLGEIRYIGNVGTLARGASLMHTHSALPMEAVLEEQPWPDIVLGDHGFAGAALERSIPAIAVMDINDPALAVAYGEGKDVTIIPMDDNRPPRLYEPVRKLFEHILGESLP